MKIMSSLDLGVNYLDGRLCHPLYEDALIETEQPLHSWSALQQDAVQEH